MSRTRDFADLINGISATKITSGSLDSSRIPNLSTANITSGTFANARLSSSSITQHVDLSSIDSDYIQLRQVDNKPNRNVIINGDMSVAQRGTSTAGLGTANVWTTVDRVRHVFSGTNGRVTSTQESISDLAGFTKALKVACTTADTSIAAGEYFMLQERLEGLTVQNFQKGASLARGFAVSFYVKGNAAATYTCELYDNTNNRQISKTFNVTSSWTRVKLLFPADTTGALTNDNGAQLVLSLWLHAGSTYTSGTLNSNSWAAASSDTRVSSSGTSFFDSTSRTFFITGLQLEPGDHITEFEHESYEKNFDKCRRYYQTTDNDVQAAGFGYNYHHPMCTIFLPITMRAAPTVTWVNSGNNNAHSSKSGHGGIGYSSPSSCSFNQSSGSIRFFFGGGSWNVDPTEWGQAMMGQCNATLHAEP